MNTPTTTTSSPSDAHPPVPFGCTAGDWYDDGQTVTRTVYGQEWSVGTVKVRLIGEQDAGGDARMAVQVFGQQASDGDELSGPDARALARVLMAAADALDEIWAMRTS